MWSVGPWLTTLRARCDAAAAAGDADGLGDALAVYARAAAAALDLALSRGLVLDVNPGNFAADATGRPIYLDDDLARGDRLPGLAFAVLRRIDEYAAVPAAVARYVAALAAALRARPAIAGADLDLAGDLVSTTSLLRTDLARRAAEHLAAVLRYK